jgi:hypothetical protein
MPVGYEHGALNLRMHARPLTIAHLASLLVCAACGEDVFEETSSRSVKAGEGVDGTSEGRQDGDDAPC